jgi:hypothetical protein
MPRVPLWDGEGGSTGAREESLFVDNLLLQILLGEVELKNRLSLNQTDEQFECSEGIVQQNWQSKSIWSPQSKQLITSF